MCALNTNKTYEHLSNNFEPTLNDYIQRLQRMYTEDDDNFPVVLEMAERLISPNSSSEEKIQLYELAGDYYYSKGQLDLSVLYYLMAFEAVDKLNITAAAATLVNKICRSYYNMNKFQDALHYISFVLNYEESLPRDSIAKLIFNEALCYKSIGLYEEALAGLLKLDRLIDKNDTTRYFDIVILQANCFIMLKQYDKAIEKYLELLSMADTDVLKQIILILNLSKAYIYADNKDKAEECVAATKVLIKHLNPRTPYKLTIYKDLAKIFIHLDNTKEAKKYLLLAYKFAKQNKNTDQQKEILDFLFEICDKSESLSLSDFIKEQMLYLLNMNSENSNWLLIFKLLNFYNRLGKNHQVDEILTVILNMK